MVFTFVSSILDVTKYNCFYHLFAGIFYRPGRAVIDAIEFARRRMPTLSTTVFIDLKMCLAADNSQDVDILWAKVFRSTATNLLAISLFAGIFCPVCLVVIVQTN